MFLGLDIGARLTYYALTEDGAHFIQGAVTLDTFPALLARQSFKTDKRDAETIARILYIWGDKDCREMTRLA